MPLDLLRRAAPWIALALIFALITGVTSCRHRAVRAAAARIEAGQAAAATDSARDAIATADRASSRERDSDTLTRTNERNIRDAHGADQTLDPAVARAGLDGLCQRVAYRDSQRCKLRGAAAR